MDLNPNQFGLRDINPNQMALPGMEHLAHPMAPFLAKGVHFDYAHEGGSDPMVGDRSRHYAEAHYDNVGPYPDAARIEWAGRHDDSSEYPGEIHWAGNNSNQVLDNEGNRGFESPSKPPLRGLTRALLHTARTINLGQDTIPIHSPSRTDEGDEFAQKTGDPGGHPIAPNTFNESYRTFDRWRERTMPKTMREHPYAKQEDAQMSQLRTRASEEQSRRRQPRLFR